MNKSIHFFIITFLLAACAHQFDRSPASKKNNCEDAVATFMEEMSKNKSAQNTDFKITEYFELNALIFKTFKKYAQFKSKRVPLGSVEWSGPKSFIFIEGGDYSVEESLASHFYKVPLMRGKEQGYTPLNTSLTTFVRRTKEIGIVEIFNSAKLLQIKKLIDKLKKPDADYKILFEQTSAIIDDILKWPDDILGPSEKKAALDPDKILVTSRPHIEMLEGYFEVTPKMNLSSEQFYNHFFTSQTDMLPVAFQQKIWQTISGTWKVYFADHNSHFLNKPYQQL